MENKIVVARNPFRNTEQVVINNNYSNDNSYDYRRIPDGGLYSCSNCNTKTCFCNSKTSFGNNSYGSNVNKEESLTDKLCYLKSNKEESYKQCMLLLDQHKKELEDLKKKQETGFKSIVDYLYREIKKEEEKKLEELETLKKLAEENEKAEKDKEKEKELKKLQALMELMKNN